MADWLLIRLAHEPGISASWLVADTAGRIVTAQSQGPLAEAAALAGSHRVCVLAPAVDVLLTEADVPIRSGMKVQQIVPFALEEQLAEDVENLHFAVGKRPSDAAARTPVAVVSRASLDEWLAQLRAAGIQPDAVFAESELVPSNPGQAVGLLDADCAIVRPVGGLPVTMPIDALAEALELLRPRVDEMIAAADRTGQGLVLYTGAAEWHQRAPDVEAIRDRFDGIKVQLLTDGPLALLAQQLPAALAGGINLLQGPYAPATSRANGWKVWRAAAVLLAALIGLHAAGSAVELVELGHAEHQVNIAVERTFRAAMPGEHNAVDARNRMEQRLASLRNGGTGSGLLAALSALAQARAGTEGTVLQALTFREGTLDLRIAAPNPEVLDRLSRSLRASGWQADLTAGSVVGSRYEGHVQIKPRA